jgi:hypothetical protein
MHDDVLIGVFEQQFQNRGPSPEREIYVYREGFYRGMLVALAVLALSLFLLAFRVPRLPLLGRHDVSAWEVLIAGILAAAMSAGMYRRAARFSNYRIVQALMTRLLVIESAAIEKEKKDDDGP